MFDFSKRKTIGFGIFLLLCLSRPALAEEFRLYPWREPLDDVRVYYVKPGDTLSGIAKRFYGDSRYWRLLNRVSQLIPQYAGRTRSVDEDATGKIASGDRINIPPVKGRTDLYVWTDLSNLFGPAGHYVSVAYNDRQKYWLITTENDWYLSNRNRNIAGVAVYKYDGKKITSLTTEAKKVIKGDIMDLFFDGEKFWIIAAPQTDPNFFELVTYDGKIFIDQTEMLSSVNTPFKRLLIKSKIAGNKNQFLLAAEKRLFRYKNGKIEEMLNPYEITNEGQWEYDWLDDMDYSGRNWMIAVNGFLYYFDGSVMENIAKRPELSKLLGPQGRGVRTVSWDPQEKKWLIEIVYYENGRHEAHYWYDIDKHQISDLPIEIHDVIKSKSPEYGSEIFRTPMGWFIQHGQFEVIRDGKKVTSNFLPVVGKVSCNGQGTSCIGIPADTSSNRASPVQFDKS